MGSFLFLNNCEVLLFDNDKLSVGMKRRSFFKNSLLASLVLGSTQGLLSMGTKNPKIEGDFVHMVFFFLKESTSVEKFKQKTGAFMESMDLVRSYHVGEPAGTPREVVDSSYSVCLVATFNTKEDQDAYQEHPIHKKYVEELKDQWNSVQIFDSWAG